MRPFCVNLHVDPFLRWTKEDHEIFDLVSDLETSEGELNSLQ